jgi:hypothetical protein
MTTKDNRKAGGKARVQFDGFAEDDPANYVDLGNDLYVFTGAADVTRDEQELGLTVTAHLDWFPELGQVACSRLTVDSAGAPVTVAALQRLRLGDYILTGGAYVSLRLRQPDGTMKPYNPGVEVPGETIDQHVARLYTYATAVGRKPVDAVATFLECPVGTAAKRVQAARKAGFLPATTMGKARGGVS